MPTIRIDFERHFAGGVERRQQINIEPSFIDRLTLSPKVEARQR